MGCTASKFVIIETSREIVHEPVIYERAIFYSLVSVNAHTTKQYLKYIHSLVSKITFDNPHRKELVVKVNNVEYCRTTDNNISFKLPDSNKSPLTAGQIIQKNTINCVTEFINKYFPNYYQGKITENFLNLSANIDINIEGLPDFTKIKVDLCKVHAENYHFPMGFHYYRPYSSEIEGKIYFAPNQNGLYIL